MYPFFDKQCGRRYTQLRKVICTFLGVLILFINTQTVAQPLSQRDSLSNTIDELLIVDCLLPGQIKQLGLTRTYLGKKRPIKTSGRDCAIRGGEYIKFDRANLKSRISIWQQSADLGDAKAQYYLGQLYEQGIGQLANLALAAKWYKKAAEKSYAPAQLSLGRFYEQGVVVEKDLVKAINLYRLASGLSTEEIAYASAFEALRKEDQQTIKVLKQDITQKNALVDELTKKLLLLRKQLRHSNQNIHHLKATVNQLKSQLSTIDKSGGVVTSFAYDQSLHELNLRYTERQSEHQLLNFLQQRVSIINNKTDHNAPIILNNSIKAAKDQLNAQSTLSTQRMGELQQLQQGLDNLKRRIALATQDKQLLQEAYQYISTSLQSEKEQLEKQLTDQKNQLLIRKIALTRPTNSNNLLDQITHDYSLESQWLIDQQQHIAIAEQQLKLINIKLQTLHSVNATEPQVHFIRLAINERQQQYNNQTEWLEKQLAQYKRRVEELTQQLLIAERSSVEEKNQRKRLGERIQSMSETIIGRTQSLAEKTNALLQANSTISQLRRELYQRPKQQGLMQLKNSLQKHQQSLQQEQQKNTLLLEQLATTKQSLINRNALKSINKKPTIAIKWPLLNNAVEESVNEGEPVKRVAVAAGKTVNIVGGVHSLNTIKTFAINDELETLDIHGLFLKSVDVADQPIQIVLKATDMQGQLTQSTIILEPSLAMHNLAISDSNQVDFGRYHALVIGNNDYAIETGLEPLNTAVNDAKEVAKVLREKYGFQVTLKTDVTRHQLLLALENMRKTLSKNDNLLIYYAGHGVIDPENDQGYWVPTDGALDSAVNWVSNATITDQIRAMSARNIMVIADSCYSASLMRSGIVTLRSGLSIEKKRQRLKDDIRLITRVALSSGGIQPVVDAIGNSDHSVFTGAMLDVLKNNSKLLDADSLATTVGHKVSIATRHSVKQVPRYAPLSHGGHQGGEFYFVPTGLLETP